MNKIFIITSYLLCTPVALIFPHPFYLGASIHRKSDRQSAILFVTLLVILKVCFTRGQTSKFDAKKSVTLNRTRS